MNIESQNLLLQMKSNSVGNVALIVSYINKSGTSQVDTTPKAQKAQSYAQDVSWKTHRSVEIHKRCLSRSKQASKVWRKRAETNGIACFRTSASCLVKRNIVQI